MFFKLNNPRAIDLRSNQKVVHGTTSECKLVFTKKKRDQTFEVRVETGAESNLHFFINTCNLRWNNLAGIDVTPTSLQVYSPRKSVVLYDEAKS